MKKVVNEISTIKTIEVPRWLFESMKRDSDLIRWITKCRGIGWIKAVEEEMKLEEKNPSKPHKNCYKDGK